MPVSFVKQRKPEASAAPSVQPGRLGGLGRVLIVIYVVLALAATFRSIFQIIRKFDEAPLAYSLSALAALVYVLATIALIRRRGAWRTVAWITLSFELVGVLVVGTLSLAEPQLFGHPSVWSNFGQGYVFVPLVLPVLGLILLRSEAKQAEAEAADSTSSSDVSTTDVASFSDQPEATDAGH